jgi:DNA-binding CsgD family transcriptional regulator
MRAGKGVTATTASAPHPGQPAADSSGVARLTALEISTLRHVLDHRTAKEIARIEHVSEDAIVNRINRARAKLGGVTRVQAARLVEQYFGAQPASHPLVSQPMGGDATPVSSHVEGIPTPSAHPATASGFGWPFPTKRRPINDDPVALRIAWPFGLAFLTVLALVMLNTVLQSLNNLRL